MQKALEHIACRVHTHNVRLSLLFLRDKDRETLRFETGKEKGSV